MVRTENRRRDREDKFMREPAHTPAPEPEWEKLRPALDEVMHELKEADREAVLLRYFENRQFAEVGTRLGLNENAARMRVERALEKLRAAFLRRGVAATTALASVISANAVQVAPANLAATLTITSMAAAGTGTFTFLKIMTATKLKLALSTLVVASATTTFVIQHQAQEKLRGENEALQQQIAELQNNNENYSRRLTTIDNSKKLSDEQFNELLRLRGEVGVLRLQTNELGKLQEENQQLTSALKQGGSFPASKLAPHLTALELLQQEYQKEEAQIGAAQTNLDLLRKAYNITDNSNDSIDENGNTAATFAEQPYWNEKRELIQMLHFHHLLATKIEAEKLDQIIKNQNGSN
jgi:cell division protein FtsL